VLIGGPPGCPQSPKSPAKNAGLFDSIGARSLRSENNTPTTLYTEVCAVLCLNGLHRFFVK
jgi:hypothetical protein